MDWRYGGNISAGFTVWITLYWQWYIHCGCHVPSSGWDVWMKTKQSIALVFCNKPKSQKWLRYRTVNHSTSWFWLQWNRRAYVFSRTLLNKTLIWTLWSLEPLSNPVACAKNHPCQRFYCQNTITTSPLTGGVNVLRWLRTNRESDHLPKGSTRGLFLHLHHVTRCYCLDFSWYSLPLWDCVCAYQQCFRGLSLMFALGRQQVDLPVFTKTHWGASDRWR